MNREEASKLVSCLFESWYSSVVRYAFRLAGNFELAEDMVQEAFMLLYSELRRGTRIDSPKGWTLCVVRRQISKYLKSAINKAGLHEPLDLLDTIPLCGYHWREPAFDQDDATKLLSLLTSREEEVLLLRMEALKYREIASLLGISPNSVNTLLARAIRKLQRAVGKSTGQAVSHDDEKSLSKTLH